MARIHDGPRTAAGNGARGSKRWTALRRNCMDIFYFDNVLVVCISNLLEHNFLFRCMGCNLLSIHTVAIPNQGSPHKLEHRDVGN